MNHETDTFIEKLDTQLLKLTRDAFVQGYKVRVWEEGTGLSSIKSDDELRIMFEEVMSDLLSEKPVNE